MYLHVVNNKLSGTTHCVSTTNRQEDTMLSVKNRISNIRLGELQLDYFIDAAFFAVLITSFTIHNEDNYLYKLSFFTFLGFTVIKVFLRLYYDGKLKLPAVCIWYLLFTLYSLASVLWAKYPQNALESMTRMVQILTIFFCMSQSYATPDGFRRCAKLFCWAGIYCAVFIFAATPVNLWFSGKLGQSATGNNVNNIGLLLSLCIILCLYYAYYKKKRLYYLFAVIEFAAITLTSSRRSTLAALGGVVLIIFLKDKSWKLLLRTLIIIGLSAGVIYSIFNIEPLYNAIGVRFASMFEYAQTNSGDTSLFWRDQYIAYAKKFFFEHPLLGIGTANFSPTLNGLIGRNTYAHNNYYELLANNGILGFGIYYSFYIYLAVRLSKAALIIQNSAAKAMLTILAVILVSEYSIVIYRTVYIMAFICLLFLFLCAFDINAFREQNVNMLQPENNDDRINLKGNRI